MTLTLCRAAQAMALALLACVMVPDSAKAQDTPGQFFAEDRARHHVRAPTKMMRRGRAVRSRGARLSCCIKCNNCGGQGVRRSVNPRLIAFANRFGCRIISGYRPGARTPSGRISQHASGNAIDVLGCRGGAVAFARANGFGVGTYCVRPFHKHISTKAREQYSVGCGRRKTKRGRR